MSVYMLIILFGVAHNNNMGFATDKIFFDSLSNCKQAIIKIKDTDTGEVKKQVSRCIKVDGVVN